jgi:hypothetical protein
MSFSDSFPSCPTPNNGDKGNGKKKGKGKDKNNDFGGSDNNSTGSNTLVWPGMCPPQ